MKIIFVILDGSAEPPSQPSALETANKPNLDFLTRHSYCGMWLPTIPQGYNIKSLSEVGILQLLGYMPEESPGRGYLEALGLGLKPHKDSIYVRANFANVDDKLNIIDRRAGRDDTGLEKLAKLLNMTIDEVKIKFYRSLGHRGVLVVSGKGLSAEISDSDLGQKKPAEIKSLTKSAAKTAKVLNEFSKLAYEKLSKDAINKKRKYPANYLLLRGAAQAKEIQSFQDRWDMKGCCVAADGITKGIARYVRLNVVDVIGATGNVDTNLEEKFHAVINAISKFDFVLLHIKGTDVCSHNKDFKAKVKFIERLDKELFSKMLKLRNMTIVITADHATSSKTGEHVQSPVPFLVYYGGHESNNVQCFCESKCEQGEHTRNPMERLMLSVKGGADNDSDTD